MKTYIKLIVLVCILLIFHSGVTFGEEKVDLQFSNGVLWVGKSDEYKLCVHQAYNNASESLADMIKAGPPENWCVVMDIDDTMLSTVNYMIDLETKGAGYSDESWIAWYDKNESFPLPGSVEFTVMVRKLGGKIIIITNTQAPLKEKTINKLKNYGYEFDVCLLREGPYESDFNKVLRINDVSGGTIKIKEYKDMKAFSIVMRVGDSAHDLYDTKKYNFEDVKDRIGKDLIVIPNPMYGSWSSD